MNHKISVLIVEPSFIIVEGLISLLEQYSRFNVLVPLHDASALTDRINVQRPDVLIINPTLLAVPERQSLYQLQQLRPTMSIVALIYQYVPSTLEASFKTVLDIRENRNRVASLIEESVKTQAEETGVTENYELSSRETDVLVLVAKGLSSKEIADQLNISVHTVSTHRKNITRKTGIKSVAGLAVYATINNLT